jgi:isoleucyl-tRNA synthetase
VVSPWEILDAHGADAFRWYLYTASPAGQERRFSGDLVGEVIRTFTLTLWNTYSFFINYANLDGWKPEPGAKIEYSTLDLWLRSALHTLVRDVTEAYENYDSLAATRPVEIFVDQLSNWFLRRSRRRYWKTESDGDKQAAYATLYEALVTLSKLLAPAMPFLAEELYQNLVLSFDPAAPESVHLADWPVVDNSVVNENLNREMALVMKLASLGHAARNKANRKVRQPLAECAFSLGSAEEGRILTQYADILIDELNVKKVRALNAAGEAVAYSLNPLPKQLGQKYGPKFPAIRQAVMALNPEEPARLLLEGKNVPVVIGGETFDLLPDEIEVCATAREGYAVANDGATLAALVTELDEDLILEGLSREVVRRVQDLRKTAGLEISDRIKVVYQATPQLAKAIESYREYITAETLTVDLKAGTPTDGMAVDTDQFDSEELTIGLEKA